MSKGEAETSGHYPYQVPIDSYGNGGFRFAGMSHRGSLLCLPTGMHAWDIHSADELSLQILARAYEAANELDVIFLGLGNDIAVVSPDLRAAFSQRSCVLEPVSTGSAIRTYNILLGEHRAVGAALIAVDDPFAR